VVRGALLNGVPEAAGAARLERFLQRYRQLLIPQLEDQRPYFYWQPADPDLGRSTKN